MKSRTRPRGTTTDSDSVVVPVAEGARIDRIREGTAAEAELLTQSLLSAERALVALRLGMSARVVIRRYGDRSEPDELEVEYLSFVRWHDKWQLRVQRELEFMPDAPDWLADDHISAVSLDRRQAAAARLDELVNVLLANAEGRIEGLKEGRAKVDGVVERLVALTKGGPSS